MKTLRREGLLALFGGLLVLLATGCGPSYPECHEDEDCAEKDEYCVNAKCSQCRDDSHCTASLDESYVCESGSCQKVQGYCKNPNFPCPGQQACRDALTNEKTADNQVGRCGVECLDDTECENGWICKEGVCTEPLECTVDADCPDGKICKNNRCIEPPVCQPRQIYFDFDESYIRNSEKSTLDSNAECYTERSISSVEITGHCDERGTEEYNMALGERRAKATRKYLKRKGVDNIDTRSRGEYDLVVPNARSEADHQKNRRAEFVYSE